jgi:hypothetical protein
MELSLPRRFPPTSPFSYATAGTKRSRTTEPSVTDFYAIGGGIMNRSNHRSGSDLSEDQRFREFFRCSAEVALIMWNLLIKHLLLPDEAQIVHLLWALIFMKIYAKEKVTCGAAGGQMGAIDPKTLPNYIWPMIKALAGLEPYKVCSLLLLLYLINWFKTHTILRY